MRIFLRGVSSDFPDLLQLAFEILIGKQMPSNEPLLVHNPALDGIILNHLPSPFPELNRPRIVHFKANRDDFLQIIMIQKIK